jgi:prepilin-type N-terminal cleavage/methylation domain-containing protein
MPRARRLLAADQGFSLIEVLVAILIVGILAMLAVPVFLGQRRKGQDLEAQEMVRNVAVALATRHTDNDSFAATKAELIAIEPTIGEATPQLVFDATKDTYEITERSASSTTFTLARAADGLLTRTCSVAGQGLCRADSTW